MAGEDGAETQVAKPPDQEAANIAAYARVYRKCFTVAQGIVKDAGGGDPVEIAGQLFRQFQHDQIEMAKQNQLVNYLKTLAKGVR